MLAARCWPCSGLYNMKYTALYLLVGEHTETDSHDSQDPSPWLRGRNAWTSKNKNFTHETIIIITLLNESIFFQPLMLYAIA